MHVHPSGEWCYTSNRGHDLLTTFAIGDDGRTVEAIDYQPSLGEWPRHVALDFDGRYLYAENRRSDEIVTFAVDAEDGTLSPTGATTAVEEPVCLAFLDRSTCRSTP